jgi:membrane protease YdiL (CAAX protease family)
MKTVLAKLTLEINPIVLVELAGLCVLGYWLVTTSLGRRSLVDLRIRRNMMPPMFPLAVLLLWICVVMIAVFITDSVVKSPGPQVFWETVVQNIINAGFGIGIVISAKQYFARGLKGFGIRLRTVPKDIFWAAAYLFAVWPVVIAAMQVTLLVGKLVYGSDFYIEPHEELRDIKTYTEVSIRAAIVITGTFVAPFFEELLFRGIIQSSIRSLVKGPWTAIVISSVVFTAVHPHGLWPGIFVMGMLFGYAYEKSGSLFRPMFIHVLFNGLTFIAAISVRH